MDDTMVEQLSLQIEQLQNDEVNIQFVLFTLRYCFVFFNCWIIYCVILFIDEYKQTT